MNHTSTTSKFTTGQLSANSIRHNKYGLILDEAHNAATEAMKGLPDTGACGFAWVRISGTSPLARYCRNVIKNAGNALPNDERQRMLLEQRASVKYGSKAYPKGWEFWKPGDWNGQAIAVFELGAVAFANVLKKYGIEAEAQSRLD